MESKNGTVSRGAEPSDKMLSKGFGRYQFLETVCTAAAIIGVLGCMVAALFFRQILLASAFFALAAVGILVGHQVQKRKKERIHLLLGDFFRTELERVFGPELQLPELTIDECFLRSSRLTGRVWEKCEIRSDYQGTRRGVPFSAANVTLTHTYQRHISGQEGTTTCTTEMLRGVVIRCKTTLSTPARVSVRGRIDPEEPDKIRTSDPTFNRRFITESDSLASALSLLTPLFLGALRTLEESFRDEMVGLIWESDTLTLAFNTRYIFADVPVELDARNIDALRRWYTASLEGMGGVLDILIDNSALLQAET